VPFNWVPESAGPSGSTPDPTPYSGQGKLHVDPSAIPSLRKAFERALDKLTPQVNQARTDLRVRPWAGDPISDEAAAKFNDRSVGDSDAALTALEGYQSQLQSAVDALSQVEHTYRQMEHHNTGLLQTKDGTGC
jgi:hypothetical protein